MRDLENLIIRLKKSGYVKAAILFGSHAKRKAREDSDVDVCVITSRQTDQPLEFSSGKFDISLFHKLPLTVRYRVFKHGKILLNKDDKLLTRLKFWTVTHYLDEAHWRNRFTKKVIA